MIKMKNLNLVISSIEDLMNLIMGLSIMDNGLKKDIEKEKEYRYGKMEANIKDTGKLIKQMVKVV